VEGVFITAEGVFTSLDGKVCASAGKANPRKSRIPVAAVFI